MGNCGHTGVGPAPPNNSTPPDRSRRGSRGVDSNGHIIGRAAPKYAVNGNGNDEMYDPASNATNGKRIRRSSPPSPRSRSKREPTPSAGRHVGWKMDSDLPKPHHRRKLIHYGHLSQSRPMSPRTLAALVNSSSSTDMNNNDDIPSSTLLQKAERQQSHETDTHEAALGEDDLIPNGAATRLSSSSVRHRSFDSSNITATTVPLPPISTTPISGITTATTATSSTRSTPSPKNRLSSVNVAVTVVPSSHAIMTLNDGGITGESNDTTTSNPDDISAPSTPTEPFAKPPIPMGVAIEGAHVIVATVNKSGNDILLGGIINKPSSLTLPSLSSLVRATTPLGSGISARTLSSSSSSIMSTARPTSTPSSALSTARSPLLSPHSWLAPLNHSAAISSGVNTSSSSAIMSGVMTPISASSSPRSLSPSSPLPLLSTSPPPLGMRPQWSNGHRSLAAPIPLPMTAPASMMNPNSSNGDNERPLTANPMLPLPLLSSSTGSSSSSMSSSTISIVLPSLPTLPPSAKRQPKQRQLSDDYVRRPHLRVNTDSLTDALPNTTSSSTNDNNNNNNNNEAASGGQQRNQQLDEQAQTIAAVLAGRLQKVVGVDLALPNLSPTSSSSGTSINPFPSSSTNNSSSVSPNNRRHNPSPPPAAPRGSSPRSLSQGRSLIRNNVGATPVGSTNNNSNSDGNSPTSSTSTNMFPPASSSTTTSPTSTTASTAASILSVATGTGTGGGGTPSVSSLDTSLPLRSPSTGARVRPPLQSHQPTRNRAPLMVTDAPSPSTLPHNTVTNIGSVSVNNSPSAESTSSLNGSPPLVTATLNPSSSIVSALQQQQQQQQISTMVPASQRSGRQSLTAVGGGGTGAIAGRRSKQIPSVAATTDSSSSSITNTNMNMTRHTLLMAATAVNGTAPRQLPPLPSVATR
jgi:hypothetical protein